jgi:hypothetical protein
MVKFIISVLYHKALVFWYLLKFSSKLMWRALIHDNSKMVYWGVNEEASRFNKLLPRLKESFYGSVEYSELLTALGPALKHHYKVNSHHPEHWENGYTDMSLLDIIEMFFDWKAAVVKHKNGNMDSSIQHNEKRFKMSPDIIKIFKNSTKL